jgi:hypothetical protein
MKIRTFVLAVFVFVFAVRAQEYTVSSDNPDLVSSQDVHMVGDQLNIDAVPTGIADSAAILVQVKDGDKLVTRIGYVVVVYPNDQPKPTLSASKPEYFTGDAIKLTEGKVCSMYVVRMPPIDSGASGHLKITFADGRTKRYALAKEAVVQPDDESISVADLKTGEAVALDGDNPGVLTFTRTGVTTAALTVNYKVAGTATPGVDYMDIGASVTFAAGSATATKTVTVIDDVLVEPTETVILTLLPGTGYSIPVTATATVTIADNDLEFQPQTTPYTQDFIVKPTGVMGWQYYVSNAQGRIAVVNGRLRMDDTTSDNTYALDEAILHLNLLGAKNVVLTLDHWTMADENQTMKATFAGHDNSDGIAFSADGNTWYSITTLVGSFTAKAFPLDALLTKVGVKYTADFRIKFQQYDNYKAPSDGREFDNISVTATMP